MNNRRDMWQQYEREWLRKQATERRYEHIFKGNDAGHHASVAADLLVESGEFPSRQEALRHLLTTAHGAAHLQCLRTSKKGTAMDATIKIAKGIAETGRSWLTEEELTEKIFAHAQLDRRANESPHQAFARHFSANDEQGRAFRKAVAVAKSADVRPVGSDDAAAEKAYAKLQKLAEQYRARNSHLSPEQSFAKVFADPANKALAELAHQW